MAATIQITICHLDIRKHLISERVVLQWHRAAQGAVGSPSLEVFQNCGDVALRDVVMGTVQASRWLGQMNSEVFSDLHDSVIL